MPLWTGRVPIPGALATASSGSGRVSTFPRGEGGRAWVTPSFAKQADGAPTVPQCFSSADAFLLTKRTSRTKQVKERIESSVGRLLKWG